MSINPVNSNSPIDRVVAKPVQKQIPAESANSSAKSDRVEISNVTHLLAALKDNEIRADKVAEIQAQIKAGTYETDDKLNIAADRLLDDLL